MRSSLVALMLFFWGLSFNAAAAPSGGGGGGGLKDSCEMSGGTFTGSEGGDWACCWSNWGCYGCIGGNCKIKCNTDKCRKANGVGSKVTSGLAPVNGLAPAGMKAPIVPKAPTKIKQIPIPKNNQNYQP
ncbi:acetyltransferase [Legionella steigerwaltii]|uniref:Acetyltransferase n=1 Tax=Legionella steigerwaltii TaxID=460 RepID=A0A378LAB0_9GAMM|nr:hypothetical protein [Legionella steigerwaltii]KTD70252.1 acetyltransferase [Legionella steigerwaltii]STY23985.1 acetyltransferase [Legionella steigerwaltii]